MESKSNVSDYIDRVDLILSKHSIMTAGIIKELKDEWSFMVSTRFEFEEDLKHYEIMQKKFIEAEKILTYSELQILVNYFYDCISSTYSYVIDSLNKVPHDFNDVLQINGLQQELNQEADRWRLRWLGYDYNDWLVQYKRVPTKRR